MALPPPAGLSELGAGLRRHDPDRFFTALFAPADRREALFVLYAFNHELARARAVVREPMLALIRLQWWREVVEGARRRHEVAGPLGALLDDGTLAPAPLLEMIAGREIEADAGIADTEGFLAYVDQTAGSVAAAAGGLLGATAELPRLRALGSAYGIAGQLRSVGALAAQGRCLLPTDLLAAHGLTAEQVVAGAAPVLPAVLEELAARGRAMLAEHRGRLDRRVVAAGLPSVLARRDLRHPGRSGPRGLGDRLAVTLAAMSGRV